MRAPGLWPKTFDTAVGSDFKKWILILFDKVSNIPPVYNHMDDVAFVWFNNPDVRIPVCVTKIQLVQHYFSKILQASLAPATLSSLKAHFASFNTDFH